MGQVEFQFRCAPMNEEQREIIIKLLMAHIVKKYKPKVVHIRYDIHPETYTSTKQLKIDPDKSHVTGEFLHSKNQCWYGFHLHVNHIERTIDGKRTKVWIQNPYVDPNQRIFFDEPSYKEDGEAEALRENDKKTTIYY